MNKSTKAYISHYDKIKLSQVLPSGRTVWATYTKTPNGKWYAEYSTDSVYHICPYSGKFIDCDKCDIYNESIEEADLIEGCLAETEYIDMAEMAARVDACKAAPQCTVKYWSEWNEDN